MCLNCSHVFAYACANHPNWWRQFSQNSKQPKLKQPKFSQLAKIQTTRHASKQFRDWHSKFSCVKCWTLTPVRFETADCIAVLEGKSSLIVLGIKHLHVFRHCILRKKMLIGFYGVFLVHSMRKTHRSSLGEIVRFQHRTVSNAQITPSVKQHDHKLRVESHDWTEANVAAEKKERKLRFKLFPKALPISKTTYHHLRSPLREKVNIISHTSHSKRGRRTRKKRVIQFARLLLISCRS